MAKRTIITAGNPVLKQKAKPVEQVTKETRRLLDEMAKIMYEKDGVGLAAPQINESVQVIVIDDGNGLIELINPKILWQSGLEVGLEGCVRVPGLFGEVERATELEVEALNRYGKKVIHRPKDFLARIFQHEIDHLDGILFIEKTDSLQRVSQK